MIVTPNTNNHPWVNWEVEYAEKLGKEIIGVWAPGSEGCDVLKALEGHADSIVTWDANKIQRALEGERIWEGSDGSARPAQAISRVGC